MPEFLWQEIKTVVERAVERQQQYNQHHQKSTVAVVLDEGGLPKVPLRMLNI